MDTFDDCIAWFFPSRNTNFPRKKKIFTSCIYYIYILFPGAHTSTINSNIILNRRFCFECESVRFDDVFTLYTANGAGTPLRNIERIYRI